MPEYKLIQNKKKKERAPGKPYSNVLLVVWDIHEHATVNATPRWADALGPRISRGAEFSGQKGNRAHRVAAGEFTKGEGRMMLF
jgi:hypothetical protein